MGHPRPLRDGALSPTSVGAGCHPGLRVPSWPWAEHPSDGVCALRGSPPPAARVLMAPSSEVREGVDVSLRCDVPGEPAPGTTFSWYKDGALVHDGPDGVMELPRVASAAAGSYHCKAHGPNGSDASVSPAVALRVLCEWGAMGTGGAGRSGGAAVGFGAAIGAGAVPGCPTDTETSVRVGGFRD